MRSARFALQPDLPGPLLIHRPARVGNLRSRLCAACWAIGWLWVATATAMAAAGLIGQRVSDVLDALRAQGLTFIYNTQLVSDSLIVSVEPQARTGVELAREILAPHGLTLSQVAPRTFAVVKNPEPAVKDSETQAPARSAPQRQVEEVVVQTSRYALAADLASSHEFLDQEQVKNLPRLGDETLSVVQRLPGAATNGISSIGPIRGGVANETAILLDGLRLYEPFHLKNFFSPISLLDSRLIAGLDVYSGGFPANYGDRMSGIVDARSVQPPQSRYYELGMSLFHANALASGAFAQDRGHVLLSARRSNLSELSQLSENDFGKPAYSDGFARLQYTFNDATRASFNALLSHDRVTAILDSGAQRADDESSNSYLWATLEHNWTEAVNSRLITSYTSVSDDRRGRVDDPGRRSGQVQDRRTFHVIGLRADNEWRADAVTNRFGAEVRRLWAEYDYSADVRFEPDFPFDGSPALARQRAVSLHPDGYEVSAYWDSRFEINRRWTIQAGLRVDTQTYDGSDDAEQWSPRLSVLYNVGAKTRLRASWGRFHQSQGINELQVEDGIDRFYPAQQADHAILSLEHGFGAGLDLRLELYHKQYRKVNPRFENLFDPLVLLPEVEFDRVMIAPDGARADGVELLLNWQPMDSWSGWLSYSWSRAQDRIDGRDVYRSWDQRHAVSLGIAWTRGPWAVTLADVYHTGWPTTQLSLAAAPTPDAAPVVIGPRNAARYADFNSLDFRITRTFALPRGQLDVFLEATNLLAESNPCCTEYSTAESAAGAPVLNRKIDNWLPLVPSVGVLWRYGKD